MKKEHDEKKKKNGDRGNVVSEQAQDVSDTKEVRHKSTSVKEKEQEGAALSASGEEHHAEAGEGEGKDPVSEEKKGEQEILQSLEQVQKEKQELYDQYLRLMADFDNFKKRMAKEKADLIQFGNESLLRDFLPVIDNIERLKAHSSSEGDWEAFWKGVELIVQEIQKIFAKYDVRLIEAIGKPFNPNVHEAIQKVESQDAAPNTVVDEYQKGYTFRGRLLRPSVVSVAARPNGRDGKEEMHWNIEGVEAKEGGGEEPSIN